MITLNTPKGTRIKKPTKKSAGCFLKDSLSRMITGEYYIIDNSCGGLYVSVSDKLSDIYGDHYLPSDLELWEEPKVYRFKDGDRVKEPTRCTFGEKMGAPQFDLNYAFSGFLGLTRKAKEGEEYRIHNTHRDDKDYTSYNVGIYPKGKSTIAEGTGTMTFIDEDLDPWEEESTDPKIGEVWSMLKDRVVVITGFTESMKHIKYKIIEGSSIGGSAIRRHFKNKITNTLEEYRIVPQVGEWWETSGSEGLIIEIKNDLTEEKPYRLSYKSGTFWVKRENLIRKITNKKQEDMKWFQVQTNNKLLIDAFLEDTKFYTNILTNKAHNWCNFFDKGEKNSILPKVFNLPTQYTEALEYARQYNEFLTPKKANFYEAKLRDKTIVVTKERFTVDGEFYEVDTLKKFINKLMNDMSFGIWSFKVEEANVKFGCVKCHLSEIKQLIDDHDKYFADEK